MPRHGSRRSIEYASITAKYELAQEVAAGGICAVTGLAHVRPGDALGAESAGDAPVIAPVLTYTVLPGEHDVHAVFKALTELADEDPMLGVSWNTHLEQIHLQLMGADATRGRAAGVG